MRAALRCTEVRRSYAGAGGRRTDALRGITCDVRPGELVGLLGPNGAGKTTLLRLAAGLLRPDSGAVEWFGSEERHRLPPGVAFVPDAAVYYAFLTVREALEHYATLHGLGGRERTARVDALLESVDLAPHADKRVRECSRGMLQRVGLAQALAGRPRLLLLDETLAGLDPMIRRRIRALLADVVRSGCAVVLSTHDVSALEHLAARVWVQHDGRLLAEVDPATLTYERALVVRCAEGDVARAETVAGAERRADGVRIPLAGRTPEAVLASLREAGVAPTATAIEADDLEARYLRVVSEAA